MNSLMSQSRRVMDKTEFLAAIKLVSGEELLSMVTSVHDENGDYLIIENPIEVEEVILPNKQAGAKVQPWMKFSREEQFVVPKEHSYNNCRGSRRSRSILPHVFT